MHPCEFRYTWKLPLVLIVSCTSKVAFHQSFTHLSLHLIVLSGAVHVPLWPCGFRRCEWKADTHIFKLKQMEKAYNVQYFYISSFNHKTLPPLIRLMGLCAVCRISLLCSDSIAHSTVNFGVRFQCLAIGRLELEHSVSFTSSRRIIIRLFSLHPLTFSCLGNRSGVICQPVFEAYT